MCVCVCTYVMQGHVSTPATYIHDTSQHLPHTGVDRCRNNVLQRLIDIQGLRERKEESKWWHIGEESSKMKTIFFWKNRDRPRVDLVSVKMVVVTAFSGVVKSVMRSHLSVKPDRFSF